MNRKQLLGSVLLLVGALVLAACQPQTVIVEREVTKVVTRQVTTEVRVTRVVEKQVTRVVKVTVPVAVTPTPTPIPRGGVLKVLGQNDVETFNPLFAADRASVEVVSCLFDSPFSLDPRSGEVTPNMVERWEFADDGAGVTFFVRKGMRWSDGEPITARDYKFMFDALMAVNDEGQPVLDTPYSHMVENVEKVELVDDYTLRVRYKEAVCTDFLDVPWLPAHHFLSSPNFRFADLADHEFNRHPTVFSGPFVLQEWDEGDHVTMARNSTYWKGMPYLEGIVRQVVDGAAVEAEMLEKGQADMASVDVGYLGEVEDSGNVSIVRFLYPSYVYIGLQMGNPRDPQPRLNKDGTVNENHGLHPILGKKEVRQALAYAIDRREIIAKAAMGQGVMLNAHILPQYGWAYDSQLEPRDYDPEKARQMLAAAGWKDEDGDGIRECHGCDTAPDGTPMKLSLKTNAGNDVYENIGIIVRDRLAQVGVDVEFETLEWNAFLDVLLGQTFDMVISSWRNIGPESDLMFAARYDVPGHGFNFCSFYRPDYEKLERAARQVKGCSYRGRGEIYRQIQQIMYDEQPYIWLYVPCAIVGVNNRVHNVSVTPWGFRDVYKWYIAKEGSDESG